MNCRLYCCDNRCAVHLIILGTKCRKSNPHDRAKRRNRRWTGQHGAMKERAEERMAWVLLVLSCTMFVIAESQTAGCNVIGFSKNYSPPNCVQFEQPTNACYGFCESWSIQTTPEDLKLNPRQVITSVANCCDMDETEDILVSVACVGGPREFTFKSAKSCKCAQCRKDSK